MRVKITKNVKKRTRMDGWEEEREESLVSWEKIPSGKEVSPLPLRA